MNGLLSEQDAANAFSIMAKAVSDYAIFLLDTQGIVQTWNKAAELMKGYTEQEILGQSFAVLYTEEDRARKHPQHNLEKAAENGTYQEETWRQRKDGVLFWALVEIIAIKTPEGKLTGFCELTRDLTERQALKEQILREKERAQVTLNAIGEGVISVDAEGKVDYLNAKAEELTGWSVADAIGQPFGSVFHAVDEKTQQPQEHQLVQWLREGHGTAPTAPAVLISKDGEQYGVEDTAAPIRLSDESVTGGVIVFRDVTESRELLNIVIYQATHDALTGLVNRIEFEHRLERSLMRMQKSHVAGAILYMDLDQFKIVNDTCGHDAGDKLLQQLAELYRAEIRNRDTLARLGGDEFALIADHCSQDETYAIARKILESTRNFQFFYHDRTFKVGISIGLVTFNETTANSQEIMQRADRACYIAKEKGRNQIHSLNGETSDLAQTAEEIDWPSRLTQAMQLDQLQLYYQPIAAVNVNGRNKAFHCEVLLRLVDPVCGLILPSRFLPAAERHQLMPAIDRWVVRQVVRWIEATTEDAHALALYAINLSGKTLMDDLFIGDLEDILSRHQVAPQKLCFEVDETAVTADIRKSQMMLHALRSMGCKVCLSGFGGGTGSFAHLRQLPADFIKIDAGFVSAISDSAVDETMVKMVHEVAHLTGKQTIAEWVEDEATVQVLSRIGVDYLQGHWIGSPMALSGRGIGTH